MRQSLQAPSPGLDKPARTWYINTMTNRHLAFAVKFTNTDGKPDLAIFDTRAQAIESAKQCGGTISLHMLGEFVKVKLSPAQKAFLKGFARTGYSLSPDGRIGASAWHRTYASLEAMGLVKKTSYCAAGLTWAGLAWAVTL